MLGSTKWSFDNLFYQLRVQWLSAVGMHLRLCATCRLVQVRSFLFSQRLVRKYQATSAVASSSSNSPGEQSSGAVQQAQNQSRLQQHEASAWPALDLKRLHSQVQTQISSLVP